VADHLLERFVRAGGLDDLHHLDLVELVQIQILIARLDYASASGTQEERIGKQIQILEELIRWIDRAPNVAQGQFGLQKEPIQRQIAELRKALADMRRNR